MENVNVTGDDENYESINASQEKTNNLSSDVLSLVISTGFHPISYARTLVQLGYEPLKPFERKSWVMFGQSVYYYPNILKYVSHISCNTGFRGLFSGLGYKLTAQILNAKLSPKLLNSILQFIPEDIKSDEASFQYFVCSALCKSVSTVSVTILLQPFHVLMVRTMAQFIGGETDYSSLHPVASCQALYAANGWTGFFSGLVPTIVSSVLAVWIGGCLEYLTEKMLKNLDDGTEKQFRPFKVFFQRPALDLMTTSFTYPYSVVGTIMCVSHSGLTAGRPPYMPWYTTWNQAYDDLKYMGALKRGSSIFFRRVPRGELSTFR